MALDNILMAKGKARTAKTLSDTVITNTTVYVGENFDRVDNVDVYIKGDKIYKIGKNIKVGGGDRVC